MWFRIMSLFALLLVLSTVQSFPVPRNDTKSASSQFIVGGTEAIRGEFPYLLSFQSSFPFCGASIYNEKYAITAAHCVRNVENLSRFKVVAGDWDLEEEEGSEQVRNIKRIIVHEDYSAPDVLNDIALLEVDEDFEFNDFVSSIKLPSQGQEMFSDCVVTGWGSTGHGRPDVLQKVTVPVISDEECREYYEGFVIADSMICAGLEEGGVDSCQGDSGGPMVCDEYLGGIVSWGVGCALPRRPGVYTEVSHYVDWIKEHAQ